MKCGLLSTCFKACWKLIVCQTLTTFISHYSLPSTLDETHQILVLLTHSSLPTRIVIKGCQSHLLCGECWTIHGPFFGVLLTVSLHPVALTLIFDCMMKTGLCCWFLCTLHGLSHSKDVLMHGPFLSWNTELIPLA